MAVMATERRERMIVPFMFGDIPEVLRVCVGSVRCFGFGCNLMLSLSAELDCRGCLTIVSAELGIGGGLYRCLETRLRPDYFVRLLNLRHQLLRLHAGDRRLTVIVLGSFLDSRLVLRSLATPSSSSWVDSRPVVILAVHDMAGGSF
jgi:hypothetical protein